MAMNRAFWRGKNVFLTGHTGFNGGWLALWLLDMGAKVHGYALAPPTVPSLFSACGFHTDLESNTISDILDVESLTNAVRRAGPEIIFHMAAQPLVRQGYSQPLETFSVNVMGTAHVLEAARQAGKLKAVVNVTTDKCYENREWVWPYRENEPLGGFDPYSSSKACSELVTAAYRQSFLGPAGVQVATARAGNVIGGGDWAKDRLIPDFLRSMDAGTPISVRSPGAIRPWQHVLEPLAGYLALAEKLFTGDPQYAESWNFGPDESDARTVQEIVEYLCKLVPGSKWNCNPDQQMHEAHYLKLDSSKARMNLRWRPRWNLWTALDRTLGWHHSWKQGANMRSLTQMQIHEYERNSGPIPA